MLSSTVPLKNLINGGLAMIWLFLLIIESSNYEITDVVSFLDNHENVTLIILPFLVLFSYSFGIVISALSYRLSDIILYSWIIYKICGFSKQSHSNRYVTLQLSGPEHVILKMKNKSEELSILGGCWLNIIILSSLLVFIGQYSSLSLVFSLLLVLTFSFMIIEKYLTWCRSVEKYYDNFTVNEKMDSISRD